RLSIWTRTGGGVGTAAVLGGQKNWGEGGFTEDRIWKMGYRSALKLPLKTSGCFLYVAPTGPGHSPADVLLLGLHW
ncbi:MAG: hypothetical protein EBU90_30725, partial [Proteobacteria bacterium]|nr:hypothetical protein [Pseudomonadota bacterium]